MPFFTVGEGLLNQLSSHYLRSLATFSSLLAFVDLLEKSV
jgi:hypothetical protein